MRQIGALRGALPVEVVSVVDGDGFHATFDGTTLEFRIAAIDAPELNQPCGVQAKGALRARILGKRVICFPQCFESHDRLVAYVRTLDVEDVGLQMVRDGWAWWYRRFAPGATCYQNAEKEAREARCGLWKQDAPESPWDFRGRRVKRGAGGLILRPH